MIKSSLTVRCLITPDQIKVFDELFTELFNMNLRQPQVFKNLIARKFFTCLICKTLQIFINNTRHFKYPQQGRQSENIQVVFPYVSAVYLLTGRSPFCQIKKSFCLQTNQCFCLCNSDRIIQSAIIKGEPIVFFIQPGFTNINYSIVNNLTHLLPSNFSTILSNTLRGNKFVS